MPKRPLTDAEREFMLGVSGETAPQQPQQLSPEAMNMIHARMQANQAAKQNEMARQMPEPYNALDVVQQQRQFPKIQQVMQPQEAIPPQPMVELSSDPMEMQRQIEEAKKRIR